MTVFCLLPVLSLVCPEPADARQSASVLARQGNSALMKNDNHKAVATLSEALVAGSMPVYARASVLNDRGLAYTRMKKYELALKDFNQAIESFPEFDKAYNNRGLLLHLLGHYKEAIKDFNRAIALQPDVGATFHNRGNSLLKAGAEKSAFRDFGKAVQLLNNKSAPHLARGSIHWTHKRHYAALRELNLVLDKNPDQSSGLFKRGLIYRSLGDRRHAIQDVAKAVQLEPDNNSYKMVLAEIYQENNQLPSAVKYLTAIIDKEPLNVKAMIFRGRINGQRRRFDSALEDLDQAISLSQSSAAYAERALIYALSGMDEMVSGDTNEAIQRTPENGRSWSALGEAARLTDHYTEAERYYLEALKRDPADVDAELGLKEIAEIKQAETEAHADFNPDETADRKTVTEVSVERKAETASIGDEVNGWYINKNKQGLYVAKNDKFKEFKIPLDLYGNEKPKILEWTVLTGNYSGYGLLRYDAGNEDKKHPIEHVAILKLRQQKVLSIEPYRWGSKIAKWAWNPNDVTISDPDGIENKIILRKAVKRAPPRVARSNDSFWNNDGFWNAGPKKTRRTGKKRRVRVRKKKKKLFGIFGF